MFHEDRMYVILKLEGHDLLNRMRYKGPVRWQLTYLFHLFLPRGVSQQSYGGYFVFFIYILFGVIACVKASKVLIISESKIKTRGEIRIKWVDAVFLLTCGWVH